MFLSLKNKKTNTTPDYPSILVLKPNAVELLFVFSPLLCNQAVEWKSMEVVHLKGVSCTCQSNPCYRGRGNGRVSRVLVLNNTIQI